MSISKPTFSRSIKGFKFKELFNELGWDNANVKYPVKVDEKIYTLTGIAQKRDFLILLCEPQGGGPIPDSTARKKIDNAITKLHYEHLIIYIDGKKTRQHWELMIREQNKPIVCRPIDYYGGQEPELLFQKLEGLFFAYEDEEKLSIVDVRSRVLENFEKNAEVVTKKFYERFSKEHEKFLGFIKGIQSKVDQEWYASLMLNRLMFIYFIQKKGFLDNDRDYLRNRLEAVQQKKGKNKFYSFYRTFLLVLFHKGLGSPLRDPELESEIGKVPYLNGGLFDVHKLEHENKGLSIEDKAFERIFDFFDEYNWHLDTRITATGKDINPDVIGYIFEKYINDRAAMGAYYTKEDITEYISKNCIVPWLFDEVKRNYAKPFASVGRRDSSSYNIWSFLQQSGDTYIYPAIKHGVIPDSNEENGFTDLPQNVQSCIDPNTPDLVENRKCWNQPAPSDIALPTEIYREVIARRKRCYELRKKIQQGGITEINDFITYNLDIRQFAQDVLKETDDPKLIMEFYKAVRKITVLDPTCGSGAFLFAALNVLEPLYFACVTRMREFVEEDGKRKHKFFEEQLALIDADEHPNEEYFIYKSIILHNLYGVDIMKEAVEIAKLRLFLKLVATVDVDYDKPNLGLEPLPDIDFNIRSGNTLVGYATLADLDKGEQGGLFGDEEKKEILEQAEVVSMAYARFKGAQLVMHSDPKTYKDAKDELNNRLAVLNNKLNKYLAVTYLGPTHNKNAYETWLASHHAFHWLAEYYTTIAQGGFHVLIGNPPYVEYSKVRNVYSVSGYSTLPSGNLFPLVVERSFTVLSQSGRCGMILQHSGFCTPRMEKLIEFIRSNSISAHITYYECRPGKLFNGIDVRLAISLLQKGRANFAYYAGRYFRFFTEERPTLFEKLKYVDATKVIQPYSLLKVETDSEVSVAHKMFVASESRIAELVLPDGKPAVFYSYGFRYWAKALTFRPFFKGENAKYSTGDKQLILRRGIDPQVIVCVLNSSLFYWYYSIYSDGHNFTKTVIYDFPFDYPSSIIEEELSHHCENLMVDLKANSQRRRASYEATGDIEYEEYYAYKSKPIIDEIDKVLAKHYGFTPEELDFIINYDIKYRMGKELEEEE